MHEASLARQLPTVVLERVAAVTARGVNANLSRRFPLLLALIGAASLFRFIRHRESTL